MMLNSTKKVTRPSVTDGARESEKRVYNRPMKTLLWLLVAIAFLIGAFFAFNSYIYNEKQGDKTDTAMSQTPIEIIPIEHATGIIRWGETYIYMDPVGGSQAFAGKPAANIVLVTDVHGDHLNPETLSAVLGAATLIVPQAVKDELPAELAARATVLANDQTIVEQGFSITGTPMYNHPEAENSNFHAKGRGNGYIIEKDGFRVYIAGDTAGTAEMKALQNIDIAFVPMNLPYTMDVEEAAEAVLAFKPTVVYPYHYRGPSGLSDVARFKQLVNEKNPAIEVVLADWYPKQ